MSATTSDPAQIERELDATRSRLGGHLNELQSRLTPGQILDDIVVQFRSSGGSEFGRNLMDSVKANPVPVALTGIGLIWLMASGQRQNEAPYSGSGTQSWDSLVQRINQAELDVQRGADEPEHSYSERLAEARGHVLGVTRGAQETASGYAQRVADTLSDVRRRTRETLHDASDGIASARDGLVSAAGSFGASLQGASRSVSGSIGQGGRAAGNLAASIGDSPVVLGALGLAAGALLGTILPISDQEQRQLGGVAGQLRNQAADAAQDLLEQGKAAASTVASAAWQAGQNTASEQGLTGEKTPGQYVDAALRGELAGSAAKAAHDSLRAGDEALRDRVRQSQGQSQSQASYGTAGQPNGQENRAS